MRIEDELVNYVMSKSDRTLDEQMVRSIVYYFLAVAVNKKKRFLQIGTTKHLVNYYGLVFAPSNGGKSFLLKTMLDLIDISKYEAMLVALFRARTAPINGEEIDTAMQEKFIKAFPPIKKDSTTQAIHKSAEAIGTAAITNASFNIYSDEFFANASEPILDMLVEGHDGIYKAPMIKGNKDEQFLEYEDIEGLTTNVLGLSSIAAIMKDQKRLTKFIGSMEMGWFKRSFVYFNPSFKPKAKPIAEITEPQLSNEAKHLLSFDREAVDECVPVIEFDEETMHAFDTLRMEYINGEGELGGSKFNYLLDIYKTAKLAAILAASNHRATICMEDWKKAVEFDTRAFKMATDFCMLEHPHIRAFEEIQKESIYEHELVEAGILPTTKTTRKDVLDLVQQMAYTKNKRFVLAGEKVRKLSIDSLEINKLDKMVVSTAVKRSSNPEKEINFKSQEVKFFGKGMTIEALITSQIQSFCLVHFEGTDKAPEGHRKKEYTIPGQNMIAFDIDEGMTVEEARTTLQEYTYLLYTTKSHQREKNGIICDRFRVILPTKTMFYVNNEEHKIMIDNMSMILGVPTYDIYTRNQGRLWYTNPETIVYKNEGELVDVRNALPNTDDAAVVLPNITRLQEVEVEDEDEVTRRTIGMQKYVLLNTTEGTRNANLFKLLMFLIDVGHEDPRKIVFETNAMISSPLHESEVEHILRSKGY